MTFEQQRRQVKTDPDDIADESIDRDQPFDLYETPGYMVRRMHQIVVSACIEYWGELNLTPVQYAALMGIRAHPGLDQRSLARVIAFDRSSTGTVLEQLERRGLVRRRVSRRDRRNNELYLTEAGADLLRRAQPIAWQIQDRLFEPLSDRDREEFVRILGRLVEANNALSRAPLDPGRAAAKPRAAGRTAVAADGEQTE